jgi:hypothetical protein
MLSLISLSTSNLHPLSLIAPTTNDISFEQFKYENPNDIKRYIIDKYDLNDSFGIHCPIEHISFIVLFIILDLVVYSLQILAQSD